jgi:hypothetical protein
MVRFLTREEVREQIRQITTPGTPEFQKWQSGDQGTSERLIDLHKILTPGQIEID